MRVEAYDPSAVAPPRAMNTRDMGLTASRSRKHKHDATTWPKSRYSVRHTSRHIFPSRQATQKLSTNYCTTSQAPWKSAQPAHRGQTTALLASRAHLPRSTVHPHTSSISSSSGNDCELGSYQRCSAHMQTAHLGLGGGVRQEAGVGEKAIGGGVTHNMACAMHEV